MREVLLRGNSPAAITAGIMILTRARQLGDRVSVAIVGDSGDLAAIPGPAVCYAPVLASCGVGREHGYGATVVVPGPPGQPVLCTVTPHGVGGWFLVDRTGNGSHPATQAYVRMSRDPRDKARKASRALRKVMDSLGLSTDPAVLDVLFGADVPPLTRLAVALRCGRAMSGNVGEPITRFLSGSTDGDPLPPTYDAAGLESLHSSRMNWILDGVNPAIRDDAEDWVNDVRQLALNDGGRDLALLYHLAEIASHLVLLPPHSILPPLGAAEDSVAVGLRAALKATGDGDANQALSQVFRFLGGTFADSDGGAHVHEVSDVPAPVDKVARWEWFCQEVRKGRKRADVLWPEIIDPPQ